eukprot:765417-Hanusia_phi.AAC.1
MLVISWSSKGDRHTLTVDGSTKQQMTNFKEDLKQVKSFFPGMRQKKMDEKSIGEARLQVAIFSDGDKSCEVARVIKRNLKRLHGDQENSLDLSVSVVHPPDAHEKYLSEAGLVNLLCISAECLKQDSDSFRRLWNELLTRKDSIIIPIILDDYTIHDKIKWWPIEITGMEKKHSIYHPYKSDIESMRKLYKDVLKKLQQGVHGSPVELESVSSQNKLFCEECLGEGLNSEDDGDFELSESNLEEIRTTEGNSKVVTCRKGHARAVQEVLRFNSKYSPCPSCLELKKVPHFFKRPACLSRLQRSLMSKAYCISCERDVDVIDIVPPQVFLSYNWGAQKSTQEMVRRVKQAIEEKTIMQCWFDVEGGINLGDDHIKKMKLGVKRCSVFVLFISDKYVKSPNCRRELTQACLTAKYIIPVFVPVLFEEGKDTTEKESESGWKGRSERWWERMAEIETQEVKVIEIEEAKDIEVKKAKDGETGAANEIKVLEYLSSIPKTYNLGATTNDEGRITEVQGLEALVAAVQARVYRGGFTVHEVMHLELSSALLTCSIQIRERGNELVGREREETTSAEEAWEMLHPGGSGMFGYSEGYFRMLDAKRQGFWLRHEGSVPLTRSRQPDIEASISEERSGEDQEEMEMDPSSLTRNSAAWA